MPEINFLNSDNLSLLWSYVGTLLRAASPGVLISFAIVCVGFLMGIVIRAWKESASPKSSEDEDVEIRRY